MPRLTRPLPLFAPPSTPLPADTGWGVDLFCGAGGLTEGLRRARKELGLPLKMAAVNHWLLAMQTLSTNHPDVEPFCDPIETLNPRDVVPAGEHLRLLIGAPPCTHFSNARGGKPRSEQLRATPRFILRWLRELRPDKLLLENVPEFLSWGPLHANHANPNLNSKPIKARKGEFFRHFVDDIRALGYQVEWHIACCADYGDPTSRRRLFIRARLGTKPIKWPAPTHAAKPTGNLKPWRTARSIIDWSRSGQSIFSKTFGPRHNRYLVINTMKRIRAGLEKHSGLAFLLGQQSGASPRVASQPVPTVAAAGAISVIQPHLVMFYRGGAPTRSPGLPLPAVTAQGQHIGLTQPGALEMVGSDPRGGGGPHAPAGEPVLVEFHGGADNEKRTRDLNGPLPTQDTGPRFGLAQFAAPEPALLALEHSTDASGHARRVFAPDAPLPTLTARGAFAMTKPVVLTSEHLGRAFNVDDAFPVITSTDAWGAATPHAEPCIVPCHHGENDTRSHTVDQPFPGLTSLDGWAMCDAYFTVFNGTGESASATAPLLTVTSKARFGLNQPHATPCPAFTIPDPATLPPSFAPFAPYLVQTPAGDYRLLVTDGRRLAFLDIHFRMLEWPELARAHSLDGYTFAGTREDIIKQIGNSVPVETGRAHILAALQEED